MRGGSVVLFDLDGTLTDSASGIVGSLRHAFGELSLPVPPDAVLRGLVGPPLRDTLPEYGVPAALVDRFVVAYHERYTVTGMFENAVFDGIPELLGSLHSTGARLVVATSKPRPLAVRIVEHFGLDGWLHTGSSGVFGADEQSAVKAVVIGRALAALGDGVRGPVVMVGDRHHDVEGAAAHGIPAIGVSWGYAEPGELEAAGASAVATSPVHLRSLLRSFSSETGS